MKNIRRRVYDALNVLMAMNIIEKEKKEIRWVGLPTSSAQECQRLEVGYCRSDWMTSDMSGGEDETPGTYQQQMPTRAPAHHAAGHVPIAGRPQS